MTQGGWVVSDALLERAQKGSLQAFSQLVLQNQSKVRGFVQKLIADPHEAEDLAQISFVKAWQKIRDIKPGVKFSSFVCAIAYRQSQNWRRQLIRRLKRDQAWQEQFPPEAQPVFDLSLSLNKALSDLKPQARAAIILCVLQDHSHEEAALILQMPLGSLKSTLLRAKTQLALVLRADHDR